MIKQVSHIRDRILQHLHQLGAQISLLPEVEHDALNALRGPDAVRTMTDITDFIMGKLGGAPQSEAADPRFSKTRRAVAKSMPKPPRGERRAPASPRQPAKSAESNSGQ